ncbi:SRPBCC family protein [Endozoicomonas arenosclerae]|uniref:SRPBCC family protein n=1 Tax=Endozoicomonas arenosclerae TaxID=1633495 RepID=UPI00078025C3|nr:SRPBCC family protein [Endozoicomonas arenosclerae]
MKISKSTIINKPVEEVWNLVAHQFDQAHLWMGPIPRSVAVGPGQSDTGAPMEGRLCDLSNNPDGAKAKEIITHFSEQDKTLTFDVLPVNNPAIIPIKKNHVQMSVRSVGHNKTEVTWTASPQLKLFAYPFYPLLRLIFPAAFGKLLKGLKEYAEQSLPGHTTSAA